MFSLVCKRKSVEFTVLLLIFTVIPGGIFVISTHHFLQLACLQPDWKLADPICTFLFSVLVLMTTIAILRDTMNVLMEGKFCCCCCYTIFCCKTLP